MPRRRSFSVERLVLVLPAMSVCMTFGLAVLVSDGSRLRISFFEAAAQIIPVLLLALAVEGKMLSPIRNPSAALSFMDPSQRRSAMVFDVLTRAQVFLAFAWGEWRALEVVASGRSASDDGKIVIAALAAGFVGLAALSISDAILAHPQGTQEDSRNRVAANAPREPPPTGRDEASRSSS